MTTAKPQRRVVPAGVRASDLEHYEALPLAKPTLDDPAFGIIAISRTLTPDGLGHTLMAGTWNTPETIGHLLSFHRPGRLDPDDVAGRSELRRLYTFGHGLNSHPRLLHGGVLSTVLDSTMSNMAGLALQQLLHDPTASVVTAQLNVKFQKPVATPTSILVRSWVKMVEDGGRKIWVEAVVEGGPGADVCHARADGLWLRINVKGKL